MVVLATVSIVALLTACGDATSGDNPDQAATTETTKASDEFAATIPVEGEPVGLAATGTSVWAALSDDYIEGSDALLRIDPATDEVVATVATADSEDVYISGLAITDTTVWAATGVVQGTDTGFDTMERAAFGIDQATDEVTTTIPMGLFDLHEIAATESSVWLTVGLDGTLYRLDP